MKSPVTYKKLYYVASPFANRCRSLRPNIWLLLSFISGVPATLLLGASSDQIRPLTESFQYSAPREYKLFLYTTSRLSLVRFRSGYDYLQWLSLEGVCDCSHASPVDHRRPDSKNLDHCGHFFDAFWDVFVLADEVHCLSSAIRKNRFFGKTMEYAWPPYMLLWSRREWQGYICLFPSLPRSHPFLLWNPNWFMATKAAQEHCSKSFDQ